MSDAPLFSIGIPSNRSLDISRRAVQSAADFCRRRGCELVVSDNSGSAEKAEALSRVVDGPNLHYLRTEPCEMVENWFQAFNRTTGRYVLMMGDDDSLFAYQDAQDYGGLAADVVGVHPAVLGYAGAAGIARVNVSHIGGENASQRIIEHLQASQGANLGIFTFWRRDVFRSVMDLWFGRHPTKGTYCDWAVMNALVSSGRVAHDASAAYFYNLSNWLGDARAVKAQVERAYARAGLPEGASAYEYLFNAVDSYIFISRKDSPLAAEEKFLAAVFALDMYLKRWLEKPEPSRHANAANIAATLERLRGLDDLPQIFAVLAEALEAVKPGLGAAYQDFHLAATGLPWGAFAQN